MYLLPTILTVLLLATVRWFFAPWIKRAADRAGFKVSYWEIASLRMMQPDETNPLHVIEAGIEAAQAGIDLSFEELLGHYMAGGSPSQVVKGMKAAKERGADFGIMQARFVDLAGRNVVGYVEERAEVMEYLLPETGSIVAAAQDGSEVVLQGAIKVRQFLDGLMLSEKFEFGPYLAEIEVNLIQMIEAAESEFAVHSNLKQITSILKKMHLDKQSAFEILQLDLRIAKSNTT